MKKILIADSDVNFANSIKDYLSQDRYYSEIRLAKSGREALEIVKEYKPDIVLTAVVMPDGDGTWLIKHLNDEENSDPCRVIIPMLDSKNASLENIMWSLKVDYIIVKPFEIPEISSSIKLISGSKISEKGFDENITLDSHSVVPARKKIPTSNEDPVLQQLVTNIFHYIGMPAHVMGYEYLRYAILRVLENRELLHSVTKELYPMIAKAFGSKPSRVERAIRHAIEIAWTRGDTENIAKLFGCTVLATRGKPTNSEFLAMISDKILLKISA